MRSECFSANEECKYFSGPDGCHASTHHLLYPRGQYRTALEKEYRELPSHKVQMCRQEHDELHATEQPPTKPPRDEMLRAIASQALREAQKER